MTHTIRLEQERARIAAMTPLERDLAAVNARYDAIDDDRSDSISWNQRGQSGSYGDYERDAALSEVYARHQPRKRNPDKVSA